MWGLTKQEREEMGPLGVLASLEALVSEQGPDVEIWEDDSRAWSDEMPDPEVDAQVIATSGELLAEYREAVS